MLTAACGVLELLRDPEGDLVARTGDMNGVFTRPGTFAHGVSNISATPSSTDSSATATATTGLRGGVRDTPRPGEDCARTAGLVAGLLVLEKRPAGEVHALPRLFWFCHPAVDSN